MPMRSFSSSTLESWVVSHSRKLCSAMSAPLVRSSSTYSLILYLVLRVHYIIGKLPVSFPRSVGTTPVFYNYIKGSRPLDPGVVHDNGTLQFGHQVFRSDRLCYCEAATNVFSLVRFGQSDTFVEFWTRSKLHYL